MIHANALGQPQTDDPSRNLIPLMCTDRQTPKQAKQTSDDSLPGRSGKLSQQPLLCSLPPKVPCAGPFEISEKVKGPNRRDRSGFRRGGGLAPAKWAFPVDVGQPHSYVTGRHGEKDTDDEEPNAAPGAAKSSAHRAK